ncbi:adenylate/guanylate cyclase domain-containing protein [Candidatus Woesearchaeota archaeon]|nr:adenylate/guanylate cyclase domain-containing protein [Candidatus Woesearchaeota archaeon]
MAFTVVQMIFLVLLLFTFYGCLKTLLAYKANRDFKYLVLLTFFLIISPHLWMRAYGIQMQEFLATFQFVLIMLPLALFLFYDYWERKRLQEQKDKIRIKTFFERYVNPKIINELLQQDRLELRGKRQTVTVFFMDIRGFTKMSESMSGEDVIKILNHYFDISTSIIFKYDGTVDKFVGDCVMALFNAPTNVKDHELKAVQAALEIQEAIRKGGKVDTGIGINTGEAVVGNIGSKHKMDYTAIGDTVNTAARLEGQTKAGEIVISKSVYDKVKHMYPTKHREEVMLKGKQKPVVIYRYKTKTERYDIKLKK